ncbi:MAG: hypothetical protein RL095_1815 [Verrucomicrobiota bacterium]|jgi:hypothetical protein
MDEPDWSLACQDPRAFFGLGPGEGREEFRRRYAILIRQWRPDRNPREFQIIRQAYEAVERSFKEAANQVPPESGFAVPAGRGPAAWLALAQEREAAAGASPLAYLETLCEGMAEHGGDEGYVGLVAAALEEEAPPEAAEAYLLLLAGLNRHPSYFQIFGSAWLDCAETLGYRLCLDKLEPLLFRRSGDEALHETGVLMRYFLAAGEELPKDRVQRLCAASRALLPPGSDPFDYLDAHRRARRFLLGRAEAGVVVADFLLKALDLDARRRQGELIDHAAGLIDSWRQHLRSGQELIHDKEGEVLFRFLPELFSFCNRLRPGNVLAIVPNPDWLQGECCRIFDLGFGDHARLRQDLLSLVVDRGLCLEDAIRRLPDGGPKRRAGLVRLYEDSDLRLAALSLSNVHEVEAEAQEPS